MTYNVFGGTLNLDQSINRVLTAQLFVTTNFVFEDEDSPQNSIIHFIVVMRICCVDTKLTLHLTCFLAFIAQESRVFRRCAYLCCCCYFYAIFSGQDKIKLYYLLVCFR